MAATLTRDGELTYFSFAIDTTKTETDADGNVMVYGKASDGALDSDEQIIDPDFAAKAIRDWLDDGANVRVQHNPQRDPAGVGVDMDVDEHGGTWVKSRIIEPVAQKLVIGGALRAYSVGIARPQIVRDSRARGGLIKGGQVVEISLVDRPANKNCSIQLVKAASDGHAELSGEITGDDEFIAKAIGVDLVKVGPEGYEHGWIYVGHGDGAVKHLQDRHSVGPSTAKSLVNRAKKKGSAKITNVHGATIHVEHENGEFRIRSSAGAAERGQHNLADEAQRREAEVAQLTSEQKDTYQQVRAGGTPHGRAIRAARKLTKGAGVTTPVVGKTVMLELPEDITVAFSPADLARVIQKRREPNVGEDKTSGGVDRADMPEEDFAGRGRSFPIHSPGDVSDAAQSVGRAGEGNYSKDQIRDNIAAIAHRKGPEYEAQLPDSMKAEDEEVTEKTTVEPDAVKGGSCDLCHGTGKIREGSVVCPRCHGGEKDDAGGDSNGDESVEKGEKETKITVDGDGDKDGDGDGLFDADGDGDGAVAHRADDGDDDDDDDDDVKKAMKPSGKMACKCGAMVKAKHKFCKSCGAPVGGAGEMPDKTGVKKAETPGGAAHSAGHTTSAMPEHREPDGAEVEAFEDDAHMQDGDHEAPTHLEAPTLKGDAGMLALARIIKSGAPANLGVLHDLTCAAFSPAVIQKCYPERTLATTVDEREWQAKSLDLAATLPFPEAAHAARLGQHAHVLKGSTPADILEAHEELHKAFSDANPGPGTAPTPVHITPGAYNRPYLTAGHAAPSSMQGPPNSTPITSGQVEAAQFHRGPITDGHAAPSPANSAAVSKALDDAVLTSNMAATGTLGKGRTFYSNNGKAATRAAMQAIHDHISHTFPDLCPMHGEGAAKRPDAAPATMKMPDAPHQLTKAEKKQRKLEKQLLAEAEWAQSMLPAEDQPSMITKSAGTADAPTFNASELAQQIFELTGLVRSQQKMLKKQAKTIDELSGMADPTVSAYRGSPVSPPLVTKSASPAVPGVNMADVAERTQAMVLSELEKQARNSPEPWLREAAWRSVCKLRGIG